MSGVYTHFIHLILSFLVCFSSRSAGTDGWLVGPPWFPGWPVGAVWCGGVGLVGGLLAGAGLGGRCGPPGVPLVFLLTASLCPFESVGSVPLT